MSNPAKTRILVTGGTGFIGRYVVDLLLADGFEPLVTTFNSTAQKTSRLSQNIDVVGLDLTKVEEINDLVQNYKPQIVLHLAGVTGNSDPTGNIYDEVNFTGTVNLLKAIEVTGISRVIMLGTAAEYGDQTTPFREDLPAKPVSPYAISKTKATQFALDMHVASGFPVTILRLFTAYGYGQPDKMFLSQLITHGILNHHFKMSDGIQRRDFVFIDDVAAAIRASINAENAIGRIINIAGGQGVALKDIARKVWELCDADKSLLEIGSREKSDDDYFDTEGDISLAVEILNWRPGPGILSGSDNYARLRDTIQKMKSDAIAVSSK